MEEKWLRQLIAPGSSLGGARPKASVLVSDGSFLGKKDLLELWRRIVFNMAVSNTDDHLRNHGFIMEKECRGLSVTKLYGLTDAQALEELKEIKNVMESNWRRLAEQYGLSRSEIEGMAPAFDMSFKS